MPDTPKIKILDEFGGGGGNPPLNPQATWWDPYNCNYVTQNQAASTAYSLATITPGQNFYMLNTSTGQWFKWMGDMLPGGNIVMAGPMSTFAPQYVPCPTPQGPIVDSWFNPYTCTNVSEQAAADYAYGQLQLIEQTFYNGGSISLGSTYRIYMLNASTSTYYEWAIEIPQYFYGQGQFSNQEPVMYGPSAISGVPSNLPPCGGGSWNPANGNNTGNGNPSYGPGSNNDPNNPLGPFIGVGNNNPGSGPGSSNDTGNNGIGVGPGGGPASGPGSNNDTGGNGLSVNNWELSPLDPDYCAPMDCYTPPPTPPVPFDPICPQPGYGGRLDPIQGNAIIRSGYLQYAGNLGGSGWQIYNGPKAATISEVLENINQLQGYTYGSTTPALRKYTEQYHNIKFVLDAEKGSGQDLDCQGLLKSNGTLAVIINGKTIYVEKYKIKKSFLSSYPGEYVCGDLGFGAPMYLITTAPTPQDPPPSPPKPPASPTPNNPTPPIVPPKPGDPITPPPVKPTPLPTGRIYSPIDPPLIQKVETTYGIWSNNVGNLTAQYTCSVAPSSSVSWNKSHYTIYNLPCSDKCSEPQYEVTYGHKEGSGSIDLGGLDYESPTNAIYSQYKLLCLNPQDRVFNIANRASSHVYIINIKQARMGDRFDEGNWELNLHHLSGSQHLATHPANSYTGSAVGLGTPGAVLRLIDDSKSTVNSSSYGGKYYNIVSGSLENGVHNSTSPQIFGQVFPNLGIIVLDGDKLNQSASFGTSTAVQSHGDNAYKMVLAMSGAAQYTDASGDYLGFQARRVESNYDRYYFIRVKNAEYNYSNNPSYVTGSEGMIKPEFTDVEKVFISGVGLYDVKGNLIAVGKISKPVLKTRVDEALFTVRLRY